MPKRLVRAGMVAIIVSCFGQLGGQPLTEPDEARYAEIPREMLVLRDWVTPHLNFVKYFEKPPLVYWLVAATFALLGPSDFLARLWLGVFASTSIVVAYVLARSIYGLWTARAAAALLAATPLFFGVGHVLTLDTPLSAFMALGLGSFWLAYQHGRRRRAYIVALHAATALGVLTKGPVAVVLTAAVILVFLLLHRDLRAVRWVLSPGGVSVFVLIALPWFVLVTLRNPEFLAYFVIDQHLGRYLRPSEHRQPFWFYAPIVLGGALPWSGFAVLSPGFVAPMLRRLLTLRVSAGTLFLAIWCAVVFLFFSVSGSKLGTYVLPMFCPLAVLAARFFEHVLRRDTASVLRRGYGLTLLIGVLAAAGGWLVPVVVDYPDVVFVAWWLSACGIVLAGAAGAALWMTRRGALQGSLAVLWLGMLVFGLVAMQVRPVAGTYPRLGEAIRVAARPQDLVVGYAHYVQGITYYGRHRVVQARAYGELDFGRRQGDDGTFFWKTDDDLLRAWSSGQRLFLVINRTELERLRPRMQPEPRELAGEDKKVIVVNFDAE
jgi:4-amino-4-deoxy-L-arabinose transferase-like glycosyltransferase